MDTDTDTDTDKTADDPLDHIFAGIETDDDFTASDDQAAEPVQQAEQPEGEQAEKPEGEAAEAPEGEQAEKQADVSAEKPAASDAPPEGISKAAQAEWDKVPGPVKYEVNRRLGEMQEGLRKYQEVFEPLKPYQRMAEQHGTTLEAGFRDYLQIMQRVEHDPMGVVRDLAQSKGLDLSQLTGQQQQNQPPEMQQLMQQNQALMNEVSQLKQGFGSIQQERQQQAQEAQMRQQVDEFARQHPRFEELAPQIAELVQQGVGDLGKAYEIADRMNPQQQPEAATTAAQTRANLAVSGAPGSGSNPRSRTPPDDTDPTDWAFDQAGI